jgi:membrane protease YdiL (CAAX protease family)
MNTATQVAKEPSGRGFGSSSRIILSLLAIFFFSQIMAAFITELGVSLIGGPSHTGINDSAAAQFVFMLLAEGLAILLVFWTLKRRKLSIGQIGLGRWPRINDVWRGALGFGLFYALLIGAVGLITVLFPDVNINQAQDVGFNQLNSSLDETLALVALVVLPPLGEEILVRGYLFSGLRSHFSFKKAAVFTSIIFAAAHLQIGSGAPLVWGAAIDTFVLSLVLCYLRESTGALYAGILVHSLNNLIAFGVHFK